MTSLVRVDAIRALETLSQASRELAVGDTLPGEASRAAEEFQALARRLGFAVGTDGVWTLERQPRWRVGWLGRSDAQQWHALFEASFGHGMPAAQFEWKYRDANPIGVGVWQGDALVAFYGGMPRSISLCGEAAMAVQIGDVMVEPSQRGVLTRSGPYQMATATYLELCIGYSRRHLVGFGFPSSKAFKVAHRQGLYDAVDTLVNLHWTAERNRLPWYLRASPLAGDVADAVDTLWHGMRNALKASVLGFRNGAYIVGRYLQHPQQPYQIWLVRNRITGRAFGLIVLRDRGNEGVELVDLVATPSRFQVLVALARNQAALLGRRHVNAWVTRSHQELLESPDATSSDLDITIPCNVWSPGPPTKALSDKWWLMSGDSDFR